MDNTRYIAPLPGRQTKFLELYRVKHLAFVGKKGAGKSWVAFLDFLLDVQYPEACGIFIRHSFPSIEDAIQKSKQIFPHVGGEYNQQKHCWTFPSGARFYMRCLDTEDDLKVVMGQEYSSAYVDEAGYIPYERIELVWSCCRVSNKNINTRLRLMSNPQGISAHTIWELFVYSAKEGEIKRWKRNLVTDEFYEDPNGISRAWLFSTTEENTYLPPDYVEQNLANLSKKLRQAYLTGELVIESAPDQLIPFEDLDAALASKFRQTWGNWYLGVDVAGGGDDASVITFGRGKEIIHMKEYNVNLPELEKIVYKYIEEFKGQIIVGIDSTGLGAGLYQNIKGKTKWPSNIIGIGSHDAQFTQLMKENKYTSEIKFHSYRDSNLWMLRNNMKNLNLSVMEGTVELRGLRRDVACIKWTDDTGEIQTTSKKDLKKSKSLGRSPDYMDSLSYYNAVLLCYSNVNSTFSNHTRDDWKDFNIGTENTEIDNSSFF